MKKAFIVLICLLLLAVPAFAALYELKDMTPEEIQKLSGKDLTDKYVDTMIERKASEVFYARAGFTPKEYDQFKGLLKLIVKLRQEMQSRNMEAPPVEEWIK